MFGEKKSQNLYLIFHGRFPSEKAASLFAAKSCEAFADQDLDVSLLVPRRLKRSNEVYSKYYGIRNNFKVVFLPTLDLFELPILKRFSFNISLFFFSITSFLFLLIKAGRDDIIYSNETLPLLFASIFFKNTAYEMHDYPKNKSAFYKLLFSNINSLIITNKWKQNKLTADYELDPQKTFFEQNAVDLDDFKIGQTKTELREQFNLPLGDNIVGYAGMLRTMGMEKGVHTAIGSIALLPHNAHLLIIGGSNEDIEFYKQKATQLGIADRVIFVGWVKHDLVPLYLKTCDVLIAPFPDGDHYEYYMSPMKIFEYMASRVPIVASDLNSIREILTNNKNGLLVEPNDPTALANGIKQILDNDQLSDKFIEDAYNTVSSHTWQKRAARIMDFINR